MRTVATALLALVLALPAAAAAPDIAFSVRSAKSGAWSDPGTWTPARVPGKGDAVQVRPGHTVVYDASSDDAIRTIHVAGVLRFPRDKSTRLAVGLIKVTPGETCSEDGFVCHAPALPTTPSPDLPISATPALEIGTAADPIPATVTHTIRLTYFDGMDKETLPAIIACGGRWDCHGAPLSRTWVKLGATAAKGATAVTLAEPVTGWRVGDKVIVTASEQSYGHADTFCARPGKPSYAKTEERVIAKIDGTTVTLDKGLEHAHLGAGDYRAEIANLSRNVVIESADPAGVRGHTLFHSRATGGISYAEFRHLGKEGVLGKYAIHFHLVRETMRGSGVIGASVWDSHNRWVTVHASDFL
ncbi:MAG: G8 domain-containing protein, partial [Phycisphaerae bacterium]